MLGRTASGLYWAMRYLERVENTARLLEAGFRMSLTRSRSDRSEWESVLTTSGNRERYLQSHDSFSTRTVVHFIIADPDNPGNLRQSLTLARENARMTRTALSRSAWEAINETWLELKTIFDRGDHHTDLDTVLAAIRRQTSFVRGTITSTMLRNDIYWFATLGMLIERADNTARILDTKYYVLLPASASVGSPLDRVQWEMILRSASAERSFHWLHGGEISPHAIIDFLIHDVRLPRSIAYCYDEIVATLQLLAAEYGEKTPAHELAAANEAQLTNSSTETIIRSGLHEFLIDMIARNTQLSQAIETDYRFLA